MSSASNPPGSESDVLGNELETLPASVKIVTALSNETDSQLAHSSNVQGGDPNLVKNDLQTLPDMAVIIEPISSSSGSKCQTIETNVQFENFRGMAKWTCDLDTLIQMQSIRTGQKSTTTAVQMLVDHVPVDEASSVPKDDLSSPELAPDGEKFSCLHCKLEFSERDLLHRHEHLHARFDCDVCDRCFELESALYKHAETHQRISFTCEQCVQVFTNRKAFLEHNHKVHDRKFQCDVCEKCFLTKSKLSSHKDMKDVHVRPYKCEECNMSYKLAKELHNHECSAANSAGKSRSQQKSTLTAVQGTKADCVERKLIPGQFSYEEQSLERSEIEKCICLHCGQEFSERDLLYSHELTHARFDCDLCDRSFERESALDKHAGTHIRVRLTCEKCGKVFRTIKAFLEHNHDIHDQKFQCNICEKCFLTKAKLISHNAVHAKPYRCKECNLSFKFAKEFHKHEFSVAHIGDRRYQCTSCDLAFRNKQELKSHQIIHVGKRCNIYMKKVTVTKVTRPLHKLKDRDKKLFKCSHCMETYLSARLLSEHECIHTDEKPFKCTYCEKTFSNRRNVRQHELMIHTAKRRFKCLVCKKAFFKPCDVKRHAVIHTGEKPFQCGHCRKAFAHKDSMRKHEVSHSKSYKCDQCSKTFSFRTNLTRHKVLHTGVRTFKCSDCDKAFSTNAKLKAHQKRGHKDKIQFKCSRCKHKFSTRALLKSHPCIQTRKKAI